MAFCSLLKKINHIQNLNSKHFTISLVMEIPILVGHPHESLGLMPCSFIFYKWFLMRERRNDIWLIDNIVLVFFFFFSKWEYTIYAIGGMALFIFKLLIVFLKHYVCRFYKVDVFSLSKYYKHKQYYLYSRKVNRNSVKKLYSINKLVTFIEKFYNKV